ncbi:MAG TPA: aminoacyl-tRNA hydrolase [Halothiobacillaceae bacterium]|nr:aminoacyl-tRNA hydrolase [Halothiobacillaceae bacterium]
MSIKLIVGLGNPGFKYHHTRHNAGFWALEELTQAYATHLEAARKFNGELARIMVDGRDLFLIKPLTFMNRSGQSVGPLARFFKIQPQEILVLHDELDLPPGRMRIKQGGSHGGHNGLKDIQAALGSADFWRLRIGIGHPGSRELVTGFVLTRPPQSERDAIKQCIDEIRQHKKALLNPEQARTVEAINGFRPS